MGDRANMVSESGVDMDIDADCVGCIDEQFVPIGGPPTDAAAAVVEIPSGIPPADDAATEEVVEGKAVKPDEQRNEGDFVTACGCAGVLWVDPAKDQWPRELSLYVLHSMYAVPLPDHADCLAISALLRMLELDFEVEEPPNVEYMSPSGRAPFIKCGPQLVSEPGPITRYLKQKGASLSLGLSEGELRRQQQLWSLVQSSLSAAELRVCWLHEKTRSQLTEPELVAQQPWPLSSTLAKQKRQRALEWLAAREPAGADLALSLDLVYKQVNDVCSRLSTELGDAPYFFGDTPTEFEAILYGHLFLLLSVPVPVEEQTSLSQVVQEYKNLVSLVARIDDEVFGRDLYIFLPS